MKLGVAGIIAVKHFSSDQFIDEKINIWLGKNPDLEILDVKFSTSSMEDVWASDALVIYRKEK